MKGLQQWVGSIVCFLIFVTMIQNLLPSRQYEKYIRLFTGMVLVLLVIQPFLTGLRLEDQIAYAFDSISFKNQARDLDKEILGMEQNRLKQLIDTYEQAARQDVERLVEDTGLQADTVQVQIDSDRLSSTYGMVKNVLLEVSEQKKAAEPAEDDRGSVTVEVEPVQIGEPVREKEDREADRSRDTEDGAGEERVASLRRKVEQYYGLESSQVKIEYRSR